MRLNQFLCAAASSILAFGCSDASDDRTVLSGSARVFTSRRVVSVPTRTVVVMSVDDTLDDAGQALRENLASAARLQDEPVIPTTDYCPGTLTDPLHANPIDVRFAIIHPAASSNERLTTPSEVPALARVGEANDQTAYTEWKTSIQAAIRAVPVSSGKYELLAAVEDTVALLTKQRPTRNDQERLQLESLELSADDAADDGATQLIVNVATSHDDEGSLDIAEYGNPSIWALNADTDPPYVGLNLSVATAGGSPLYSMTDVAPAYPRVASWLRPVSIVPTSLESLFQYRPWVSLKPACLPAAPIELSDGSVSCRIHLWLPEGEACSGEEGQFDPLIDGVNRAPKVVFQEGYSLRICELRQLDGPDLAACLSEVAPSIQEPGWCFPKARAGCNAACPTTEPIAQNFRFVRGIDQPPAGGVLEFTCMIEPHES